MGASVVSPRLRVPFSACAGQAHTLEATTASQETGSPYARSHERPCRRRTGLAGGNSGHVTLIRRTVAHAARVFSCSFPPALSPGSHQTGGAPRLSDDDDERVEHHSCAHCHHSERTLLLAPAPPPRVRPALSPAPALSRLSRVALAPLDAVLPSHTSDPPPPTPVDPPPPSPPSRTGHLRPRVVLAHVPLRSRQDAPPRASRARPDHAGPPPCGAARAPAHGARAPPAEARGGGRE